MNNQDEIKKMFTNILNSEKGQIIEFIFKTENGTEKTIRVKKI